MAEAHILTKIAGEQSNNKSASGNGVGKVAAATDAAHAAKFLKSVQ